MKFALILIFASGYSFASRATEATYTVPVDNAAATNPTTADIVQNADGRLTLRYQLPEDIVGPGQPATEMNFAGKFQTPLGKSYKFANAVGWSVCQTQAAALVCTSEYDHLKSNADVESFLKTKFASDPAKLQLKLESFKAFHNDPIGVLVIPCAANHCPLE